MSPSNPESIDLSTTAFVNIDVQRGLTHLTHWGTSRSNPSFEENDKKLLSVFRSLVKSLPEKSRPLIINVQHISTDPKSPLHPDASDPDPNSTAKGVDFLSWAAPLNDGTEMHITKNVNSSFIGTKLEEILRQAKIKTLFLAGLTTDHCVSTTARMAGNLNICDNIYVVGDATATWAKAGFDAETVMAVNLASLDGEFCRVVSTADAVKMLQG